MLYIINYMDVAEVRLGQTSYPRPIPLSDTSRDLWGVVLTSYMPFLFLNQHLALIKIKDSAYTIYIATV